jgi:DNA-binding transcriptional regulator YiaG
MSAFATSLRNEIVRLSRKTAKQLIGPMRGTVSVQRRHIASLRKQIAALQKEIDVLKLVRKAPVSDSAPSSKSLRFRAGGFKSRRHRLGLSAAQYGLLIGVSAQTIYNWETKKSVPDKGNLVAIAKIRPYGRRQAMAELALLNNKSARPKRIRKKRR